MKKLDTLYKTTSTGATQTWTIYHDGDEIFTKFGPEGGTIQTSAREKIAGKNLGKKNETTANEQARLEAESRWRKKLGSGYVKTKAELGHGAADDSVGEAVWPTLAKSYRKDGDKIEFPAFAQPKLDGHRCLAQFDKKGKVTLWSRKRKQITSMAHIVDALESLELTDVILDGELFNEDMTFEEMAHFIRKAVALPGSTQLEYHIFDVVLTCSFERRVEWLDTELEDTNLGIYLSKVQTKRVMDEAELMEFFEDCISSGYEGTMVRNVGDDGYYSHPTHRSNDLQKIKQFDDAEFKIVAVKEGKGKLAGHAIFTCTTKQGVEFDVKLKGDTAKLKTYFEDPDSVVGEQLTVQYQGLTGAAGVPRFPIGLRIRKEGT